jgi:sec-independent protein translocase protein TatC
LSDGSEKKKTAAEMNFFDHLDELRGVLFASLGVVLALTIGAWFFSGHLLDFIVKVTVSEAQFIKPHEAFLTRFKLAFAVGLLIGLPFVAYKIWYFVVPGLLKKEKRIVFPLVFWSTALFLTGVSFSAFVLTPVMLKFLASFATDVVQSNLAVGYMLDFYMKIGFACGLLFQLPLVIAVLSFFGIVTPQLLRSIWRHAIVGILILAAVVTPADILSQLMLGVPIILLYFISILISAAIQRGKKKEESDYEPVDEENETSDSPDNDDDPAGGKSDPVADGGVDDDEGANAELSISETEAIESSGAAAVDSAATSSAAEIRRPEQEPVPYEAEEAAESESEDSEATKAKPLTPPPDDWCI